MQQQYINANKSLLINEENSNKLKKLSKELNLPMVTLLNNILQDFFNQVELEKYIESKKENNL